ncbi:MFS transporter [Phytomonospora endophytica]|uniref:SET family sugar efflux transporter-like MFS transporter n=1 Tax=Phytomonospora endophytica TaxID=714109 RepID=A0A841FRL7_9ACTN|nr:MFS transporter [Phytomonospora endophytica]MBB6036192.1 SET family sugar efflux transporter-like MFS transporter [Phytomonospora endophytica]GIG67098.1 MFS transporter [Phytomonospora endophytica]
MRSLVKLLVRDRELRVFGLLFFLAGMAGSAAIPLVPLYMTRELGASLTEVGLLAAAGLFKAAIGLPLGRYSDRLRSRSTLLGVLSCWMAVGWLLLPAMPGFWSAAVVYVLGLPFIGAINAQIFAGLTETLDRRGESRPATITSTLRGGYSFGYVIGPLFGTTVAALAGLWSAFVVASVLYVLLAALGFLARLTGGHSSAHREKPAASGKSRLWPLWLFAFGVCLVIMGDGFRALYLSIYVVDGLHQSEAMFGALVSVAAAVEIVVFPLVGFATDRLGARKVILAALGIAVAGYTVLATSGAIWQVWLFHMLQVLVFTVTIGLGVTYAQRLVPGQTGLASSAFFSAQTAAMPIAGVLGAATVGTLGLPGIFWIPAGICAVCLLVFALSPTPVSETARPGAATKEAV